MLDKFLNPSESQLPPHKDENSSEGSWVRISIWYFSVGVPCNIYHEEMDSFKRRKKLVLEYFYFSVGGTHVGISPPDK